MILHSFIRGKTEKCTRCGALEEAHLVRTVKVSKEEQLRREKVRQHSKKRRDMQKASRKANRRG